MNNAQKYVVRTGLMLAYKFMHRMDHSRKISFLAGMLTMAVISFYIVYKLGL